MKTGAYIAEAGLDPVQWVTETDPVLRLYILACATEVHSERAKQNKG